MFESQPKTNTTVSPLTPTPFAVNDPETVNVVPPCIELGVAEAVNEVETGLVSEPVLKFMVIVPGPPIETKTTLLEPEHDNPPEQLQFEIE
jgi:hypothetical protein